MSGLTGLIPTMADVGKAKSWAIAGVGLVAGASVAYWAISQLQGAGLVGVGRALMSNTINTLPNSPYRSFRSSIRFHS